MGGVSIIDLEPGAHPEAAYYVGTCSHVGGVAVRRGDEAVLWNTFCQTSDIEAQRVREVVAEFGDAVMLREFRADGREIRLCYQVDRGMFVEGREIGWGYEAPRHGIREAIAAALGRQR